MKRGRDLAGWSILITAGPTREYLDSVRYISNDSSGKMGFAIAAAAARRGARVTLVHGPVALAVPPGVEAHPVVSADEMHRLCRRLWPHHEVLIAAAAVADYTPQRRARTKLKKSDSALTLHLRPTVDILADLSRRRRAGQFVVGFALEDRAARRNAESKLRRKNLDAILLNRPSAISADASVLEALTRDGVWRRWPELGKSESAERVLELLPAESRGSATASEKPPRRRAESGRRRSG